MQPVSNFLNHTVILITRPQSQAKALGYWINSRGGEALLLPTLTIELFSPAKVLARLKELPAVVDKVIFTSGNAVQSVMPHWHLIKPIPAVFAVGSATAGMLEKNQIQASLPADQQFNSEGLLKLPQMLSVCNQSIVIFSGEGGRVLLADELAKRGARVRKIAVYRRQRPQFTLADFDAARDKKGESRLAEASADQARFSIISTSAESLYNLWQMAAPDYQSWLLRQQLIVVSQSMVLLANQLGFKCPPLLASNASDEAIGATVLIWRARSLTGG